MDLASVGGLVLAITAILLGQALEGGHVGSIIQPTAAIIVFGGTLGAVAVQFPKADLVAAARGMTSVFFAKRRDLGALVRRLVELANKARREGLISLESEAQQSEDPFLGKALGLAVDGVEAAALRAAMEIELSHREEEAEKPTKVFEAAGGYAPTVGILGAVLGLIHVMENLSDPSKLGSGIAVAFVATVYGVGAANLVFLPMAGKLKARARQEMVAHELCLEGVVAIASGENPQLIEEKLRGFLGHTKPAAAAAAAAEPSAEPAAGKG
jgi:chemotaxis protein MotA